MTEIFSIFRREFIYIWYYFELQFRQIFIYWILGMLIGSFISVFAKDKIHGVFAGMKDKKWGLFGIVPACVLGIASIFTYGMKKGLERLEAANVKNVSLTDFDEIVAVAAKQGYIRPEDAERLIAFRNDPSDESWIGGAK